ncbi:PilN domain-containing protein [Kosakonia sp. BK9b]
MSQMVNFLPWRQRRRQRRVRGWAALFTATVLLLFVVGAGWRSTLSVDLQALTLWQQSDHALLAALVAAEQPLQTKWQRWLAAQARLQRQQQTRAWRPILTALAENLPQQAWLTQLRWQQNTLELIGLTSAVAALSELEHALQQVQGFQLLPAGATMRDAQGRWQFHYQLNKEPQHAP